MSYVGLERRSTPCKQHAEFIEKLDHEVNGNGKPGLRLEVQRINLILEGDEKAGVRGVVKEQQCIKETVNNIDKRLERIEPFMNPKLLTVIFSLSFLACIKILGIDLIAQIASRFI